MYMYLNISVLDLSYNSLAFLFLENLGIEGMCSNFFTRTNTLNARY